MSHAPETSLSSRELAEQIAVIFDAFWKPYDPDTVAATSLIDAWVRQQEAEVRRDEATEWNEHLCMSDIDCKWRTERLASVLATARK